MSTFTTTPMTPLNYLTHNSCMPLSNAPSKSPSNSSSTASSVATPLPNLCPSNPLEPTPSKLIENTERGKELQEPHELQEQDDNAGQGDFANQSGFSEHSEFGGVFHEVLAILKSKLGERIYEYWLKELSFVREEDGRIVLAVPSSFLRERILNCYIHLIIQVWQGIDNKVNSVSIEVQSSCFIHPPYELNSSTITAEAQGILPGFDTSSLGLAEGKLATAYQKASYKGSPKANLKLRKQTGRSEIKFQEKSDDKVYIEASNLRSQDCLQDRCQPGQQAISSSFCAASLQPTCQRDLHTKAFDPEAFDSQGTGSRSANSRLMEDTQGLPYHVPYPHVSHPHASHPHASHPHVSHPPSYSHESPLQSSIIPSSPFTLASCLASSLNPLWTFDNFIVNSSNHLAVAAIKQVASSYLSKGAIQGFSPICLYGRVGLGKTHLMQALAWHLSLEAKSGRFLYLSADRFMYYFIKSIKSKNMVAFKELFADIDVLFLDDVQFICKGHMQEEFFQIISRLVDNKKQIVLTADRSPGSLEGLTDRIKSRINGGLVIEIQPSDFELRLKILLAKAEHTGFKIPKEVLNYLAHNITGSIRELEGALNRLVLQAQFSQSPITLDLVNLTLNDVVKNKAQVLSIEQNKVELSLLQQTVSKYFGITMAQICSNIKVRRFSLARQIAIYLAKKFTTMTLQEIAFAFGKKDHTTILYTLKKITALDKDAIISRYITDIIKLLNI